mmetsp:Transcript_5240/g.11587  ORF Transcript_5240/g.11587 Transcript_5240/m.11587 type:complete len:214 (-) Transcript_5240:1390-2031(-)
MNHHRPSKLRALFLGTSVVFKTETNRKLKVQLNSGTLVNSLHGIHDFNINLGTVESTIARVFSPATLSSKGVHCTSQCCLSPVPKLLVSESFRRPRAQLKLVSHAESVVNTLHKVKRSQDLILNLILATVNVSIILLEATNTCKSRKCTAQLVTMQNSKVGKANRKVTVAANLARKHETVTGTVHRLHCPLFSFNVEAEHGIFVMHGVATLVP